MHRAPRAKLRLLSADSAPDLHDERDRIAQLPTAEGDKAKGHFPNDEAATKLLFLALRNVEKKWRQPPTYWKAVLHELVIHFEGRLPA